MPRRCTVCEHPQVNEINKALLNGISLRDLERQYSVSRAALFRHKNEHIPAALMQAKQAQEITKANTLFAQVTQLRDKALAILNRAEQAGDLRTALAAVRETRETLKLLMEAVEVQAIERRLTEIEEMVKRGGIERNATVGR